MATNIIVNPTELENASQQISAWNDQLYNKLIEFKNMVTSLQETWQSRASERTMEAINNLAPRFEDYKATIDDYVVNMRAIAQEYSDKEGMNATNADSTAEFI